MTISTNKTKDTKSTECWFSKTSSKYETEFRKGSFDNLTQVTFLPSLGCWYLNILKVNHSYITGASFCANKSSTFFWVFALFFKIPKMVWHFHKLPASGALPLLFSRHIDQQMESHQRKARQHPSAWHILVLQVVPNLANICLLKASFIRLSHCCPLQVTPTISAVRPWSESVTVVINWKSCSPDVSSSLQSLDFPCTQIFQTSVFSSNRPQDDDA